MQNIKEISAIDTYSVRHPILRAEKPIASCHFNGDELETTRHFGLFQESNVAGVISIFETRNKIFDDEKQFQIRGMAVLVPHQKKGFGGALVKYAEDYIQKQRGTLIWFNARMIAVGFYKKLGYQVTGNAFEIENVGLHYIMFKKI